MRVFPATRAPPGSSRIGWSRRRRHRRRHHSARRQRRAARHRPQGARANLEKILAKLADGIPVLLAACARRPTGASTYAEDFDAIFPDLARAHGSCSIPFFLDGVVYDPSSSKTTACTPMAKASQIVRSIIPSVELIARAEARRRGPQS
jgi:acyl-CoA thioesterase-1